MNNEIEVHDVEGLDVRSTATGERLGFILKTGRKEWLAIAVIPVDGRNSFLGSFPKPRHALKRLLENENALVASAEKLDGLSQRQIDQVADETSAYL